MFAFLVHVVVALACVGVVGTVFFWIIDQLFGD